MILYTVLSSVNWESGFSVLLGTTLIMRKTRGVTSRFSLWSVSRIFEIFLSRNLLINNLVFTLAILINPRLVEKNKAAFCREYNTLNTFMKESAARVGSAKDVFVNFSFSKMEKTICTKEYFLLLRHFSDNCKDSFNEGEKYALEQMLKVSSYPNLIAS